MEIQNSTTRVRRAEKDGTFGHDLRGKTNCSRKSELFLFREPATIFGYRYDPNAPSSLSPITGVPSCFGVYYYRRKKTSILRYQAFVNNCFAFWDALMSADSWVGPEERATLTLGFTFATTRFLVRGLALCWWQLRGLMHPFMV